MDMSKLPRLSQTQTPAPPAEIVESASSPPPVPQPVVPAMDAAPPAIIAAEAWIAGLVGIVFLYLGRRYGAYLFSALTRRPFHTGFTFTGGERDAQEVPYAELEGHAMLNDAAMFLFGAAVLFDAIAIASIFLPIRLHRALMGLGLAATVLATVFNLYVAIVFFKSGILPIFSLLAVAVGGYTAMLQWTTFKRASAA